MFVEFKSKNSSNHREYKGKLYGEQQAALHVVGADYPLPFKVNVERGNEYEPGRYNLASDSFGTDQHNNLRLNRVRIGSRIDATPPPVPGKN
jgi:hypothetical protein